MLLSCRSARERNGTRVNETGPARFAEPEWRTDRARGRVKPLGKQLALLRRSERNKSRSVGDGYRVPSFQSPRQRRAVSRALNPSDWHP